MSLSLRPLDEQQVAAALGELPDWRGRLGALHAAYVADSPGAALALVTEIGAAAEAADHHPDVDWRYAHVFVRTTTHAAGYRTTERDVALAGRISAIAAAAGARAEPTLARSLEIGVDTADPDGLRGTWATALGYRPGHAGDLVDPWGRGPSVWFQRTDTPATSRLHLDVHVAPETAPDVVSAVAEAGGRRLDERFVPSFWVVADADGNRLCICTPAEAPAEPREPTGDSPGESTDAGA